MNSVPKILVNIPVTDAILTSSSVAEPATGETVWVSGGTYAVGDVRILTSTHRQYKCVLAHSGVTALPSAASEATRWLDVGPTQRWAPFDNLTNTKTSTVTSASWTMLFPDFINSVSLYGLTGTTVRVVVKTGAGGATVYDTTKTLVYPGLGFWEYYHSPASVLDKVLFSDIPLTLFPEVTITVSSSVAGQPVGLGMAVIGDLRPMIDDTSWGGTQYGAQAKPTTYSYIKRDDYGNVTIVKRSSATDMKITVDMPHSQSDRALRAIQDILDVPAAIIGTDYDGYQGLNVFGLASATLTYSSYDLDVITIDVQGFV